jgi:hypothetical protein
LTPPTNGGNSSIIGGAVNIVSTGGGSGTGEDYSVGGNYLARNGGSGGGGAHGAPNFVGGGGNDTDYIVRMTSNTAPFGVASASSQLSSQYFAWKAMDKTTSSEWLADNWTTFPQWIQYELAISQVADRYSLTVHAGRSIKTWQLQASNTGSFSGEQIILDTQTNAPVWSSDKRTYSFTNSTAYKYYRISITEIHSPGHFGIIEWNLMKPIVDEGYRGGFGVVTNFLGGGGGGAGSVGVAGASGGFGGTGKISSISGASVTYSTGGNGAERKTSSNDGSSAENNTGNGGNAGGTNTGNALGGSGGSGIVIIRYKTDGSSGIVSATGGTKTTVGEYTIHTFTASGTFTIP